MSITNEDFYGGFDLGFQEQHLQQPAQQSFNQNSMFQMPPVVQSTEFELRHQKVRTAMEKRTGEHGCRPSPSDDDARSFNVEYSAGDVIRRAGARDKASTQWHRMKWSDRTVKLLVAVVSYLEEDAAAASYCNIGRKKGKWKLVSKVMAERGCYVSPQQCEDKFNDLNKRYKRLTDILGPGTSRKVVENPAILDRMQHHLSEKDKDDARKILSSKHLFYEEMCSYHTGNRLRLPEDPSVRRSSQDDIVDNDDDDDFVADSDKRNMSGANSSDPDQPCNGGAHSVDVHHNVSENSKVALLQKKCSMRIHSLRLEEQRLHIEARMVELGKKRIVWRSLRKKKDRELAQMRIANERIRLENEHLAWELKHRELEIKLK